MKRITYAQCASGPNAAHHQESIERASRNGKAAWKEKRDMIRAQDAARPGIFNHRKYDDWMFPARSV